MTDGQTQAAETAAEQKAYDPVADFALLEARKAALTLELEQVESRAKDLAEIIAEQWADSGRSKVRIDVPGYGRRTVHIVNKFHCYAAKGIRSPQIVAALDAAGIDIVKRSYAAGTLKSLIREHVDEGTEVPAEVLSLLDFGTEAVIQSRRSD